MGTIDSYFGAIPAGPPIPPIPGRTELPATLGREIRETVEQDVSLPRLYLSYRMPRYGDDRFYAAAVTSYILTWGKASLLYRTLVRGSPVLQDVTAFAFPVVVGASMLVLWATVRPGVAKEKAESELFAQIAKLRDIDDADVERAKNLIESRNLAQLQRVDERADQLSMYTTLFDDPARINTEVGRLRAVTTADIRTLADELMGEDNRGLLWYVPGGDT
jgi:predicted Zn-dependent peptidase